MEHDPLKISYLRDLQGAMDKSKGPIGDSRRVLVHEKS